MERKETIQTGEPEDRVALVRELCGFVRRGPGTDSERRAANFLAERLRRDGRRAEVEPTHVHPQYALVHALHAALAVGGGVLAVSEPAVGFALVLLAAVSLYLDLNSRFYILRRLFFRRASQNVVSRGSLPEAPERVVLVAHVDAARTGYVFGARAERAARRLSPRARVLLGPMRILFWGGFAALLPILAARMFGLEATWLSVVQLLPTVLLVVALFLFLDIALSEIVPGAYDNASGVATALAVAAQLDREPPENLDVWVLLTGGEECQAEGMRSFLRAHRDDLDRASTVFLNLDSTSYGAVHYESSEGAVVSHPTDARLVQICEAISAADREAGAEGARAVRTPLVSDSIAALIRGYRAITIMGLDDGVPPPWYHAPDDAPDHLDPAAMAAATEFTIRLTRQLDRDADRAAGR
ncbi:MAG: M20/M25/M40 family metallo-hydrolase [Solirubrobacterales bacterium]|nr:M20/M25/M40 family metallo-hydrolase [Solirubrobacterales bacterium]